jgi:hypothetical protein
MKTRYDVYKSAERIGVVYAETAEEAAMLAGLSGAVVSCGMAYKWFVSGEASYAVEVIPH